MAYEEEGKRGMSSEPGDVSAASLQKALEGINYPADKQKLINTAKGNNAPESIINVIQRLPDKEYDTPIDVSKEFGKIK